MKKLIILAIACFAAATLTSCSSYRKVQTEESHKSAFDCAGYHVSKASWEFTDNYGQTVNVTGRCTKGMRHGNFDFFVDGKQVARTKFVRNEEVKTACFVNGKSRTDLYTCMDMNANMKNNPDAAQNANNAANTVGSDIDDFGDEEE